MRRGEESDPQDPQYLDPSKVQPAKEPGEREAPMHPSPRALIASRTDLLYSRPNSGSSKAGEMVGEGLRRIWEQR